VPRDPSEIILIWWFDAQETSWYCWKHCVFAETFIFFFFLQDCLKEQHSFKNKSAVSSYWA